MILLEKCKNLFIDFDGVVVDSNEFKEFAIEKSIFQICGENKLSYSAIEYFNINAGISRKKKLSLFFKEYDVLKIMDLYSEKCRDFFLNAYPTNGFEYFLSHIKKEYKGIRIFILSGGENKEIRLFLEKHNLINFFDDVLASEKSKKDHLKNKNISRDDIFIGDSRNDLNTAMEYGLNFILFEKYKSLKSFPKVESIKKESCLKTKDFESFMRIINS